VTTIINLLWLKVADSNLTPLIPLSFEGEGEVFWKEGLAPLKLPARGVVVLSLIVTISFVAD